MECSYCRQRFYQIFDLAELFTFSKLNEATLCPKCQELFVALPKNKRGVCKGCCRRLPLAQNQLCGDCRKWQRLYPNYHFQHEALYEYNEAMHDFFQQYKFKGDYLLRNSFKNELQCYFLKHSEALIVPIPINNKRLFLRGFNQVTAMLASANIEYVELLLRKDEGTPQSSKNRQQRMETPQPFSLNCDYIKDSCYENREIIIVDDIYTTGRTLFHAANILQSIQPKSMKTFSLAR